MLGEDDPPQHIAVRFQPQSPAGFTRPQVQLGPTRIARRQLGPGERIESRAEFLCRRPQIVHDSAYRLGAQAVADPVLCDPIGSDLQAHPVPGEILQCPCHRLRRPETQAGHKCLAPGILPDVAFRGREGRCEPQDRHQSQPSNPDVLPHCVFLLGEMGTGQTGKGGAAGCTGYPNTRHASIGIAATDVKFP